MGATPGVLVFDTGPLSHFAQQGWLGILRVVVGDRTAVIPDTVVDELRAGAEQRVHLKLVLDAVWLEHRALTGPDELSEFARFAEMLAAKGRNLGECGVLAYAKANGATAVIDDGPPRKLARAHQVACKGTLGFLCEALHDGLLSIDLISAVADHLLESEYRLPFSTGGFRRWAHEQGLIPPFQ
ncbi:hypothetical protein GCM10027271_41900 [Saccharopolyspora gloriosae]|uniref:Putative nucleic acid-binding protein n=1 Tax=Saccharopolyspora gloriosae TaxID=455344 RepID=A0A840NFU6_9PSEU|nr:hypothetical protein [Saccharopolyspora gloriosae]MBB5070780.1 putative nucleic acid-binding protein [Saccharopolyspora gloriosae]